MPATATARPLSGLQRSVLNLYRRSIRMTRTKPPTSRPDFLLLIRHSFRHPKLTSRDVAAIEHLIRKGERTIEMLEGSGVRKVGVTGEMREWWEGQRWRGGDAK